MNFNTHLAEVKKITGLKAQIYNPQNIIQFKPGIKASGIYYYITTNEVISSEGNSIYFYDYASGILKNTITSSDSIEDFQVLYNR